MSFVIFTIGLVVVLGGIELLVLWHPAKADSRASLKVHATLSEPFAAGQSLRLVATVRNVGSTDAHEVSVSNAIVRGYFQSDAEALDKLHTLSARDPNTRLVLVAGEAFKEELESRAALTAEDHVKLLRGQMRVYFFSQMTYTDALGALHHDRVCEYFDPSTAVMVPCRTENSSS